MGKKLDKLWKNFNKTMDGLGDALEEVIEESFDSSDINIESNSINNTNGTSIVNKNGNVVIKGKIKSLTVNGKKVEL